MPSSAAARIATRSLADRHASYTDEVDRLIQAGLAVMQRTGTLEPRVSEVVKEAGLSNVAFYRHFRGKDELLLAIVEDGLRRLVGVVERRMQRASDPLDEVAAWVRGVMAQASDPGAADATRPFTHSSWLAERFPAETDAVIGALTTPLCQALVTGVERGQLPHADPERDAAALYQLVMGTMLSYLVRRVRPTAADVDHLVELAQAAVSR